MKLWQIFPMLILCALVGAAEPASNPKLTPERVLFRSGDTTLYGCVYKPAGKGPFPAIVYNQSATKPSYEKIETPPFTTLAQFFTSHGYVFFLPGRYTHDALTNKVEASNARAAVPNWLLESDYRNADIVAGIDWLKAQSFVDEGRIVLCGHSAGAIQSLLVAEKESGIRGTICFSVASVSWKGSAPLKDVLKKAVKGAETPILLLQPQNDYSIEPSRVLGEIIKPKGPPNSVKVFPPYGATQSDAMLFGINGANIWGQDVLKFLDDVLK